MPNASFPTVDVNKAAADFNNAVKEGAYIAVGLAVLGFQRAQVQRQELRKQFESQVGQLSDIPTTLNTQFESYLGIAREQAAAARAQLAEQFSDLSKALEEALAPVRAQISNTVSTDLPRFPDLGKQLSATNERLESQLETLRTQLAELAKVLDQRVTPARRQIEGQIDKLEEVLPAGARSVVQSARAAASSQEDVVRNALGLT